MKPAKLPGVEKFKFWDKSLLEDDDDEDDDSSVNDNDSVDSGSAGSGSRSGGTNGRTRTRRGRGCVKKLTCKSVTTSSSSSNCSSPGVGSGDSIDGLGQIDGSIGQSDDNLFIRGYLIRNTCSSLQSSRKSVLCDLIDESNDESSTTTGHHSLPVHSNTTCCHPNACHLVHHHHQKHHHHHYHNNNHHHTYPHRRKVILPISSRLAAKVLTSTDLPLDLFDIRDIYKSTRLRDAVVKMTNTLTITGDGDRIETAGTGGSEAVVVDGRTNDEVVVNGHATLEPKRYININTDTNINNNNNNNIFINKDTDDNC